LVHFDYSILYNTGRGTSITLAEAAVFFMPSETLIEQVRAGNADALAQMIEEHRGELLGFIQHISQDKLLRVVPSDDLLQEVASSAISALPRVANAELDPMSWLKQLARRRVVDAYRFHFQAERRAQGRR
jgi:RNA polymerase sigma-70 factor, ECF subfamily